MNTTVRNVVLPLVTSSISPTHPIELGLEVMSLIVGSVPCQRRGEVLLDVDVGVVGDVEHDLDDLPPVKWNPGGYVVLTVSPPS